MSFAPDSYTPKHLAEKILTSKATLEGERKQADAARAARLKGRFSDPIFNRRRGVSCLIPGQVSRKLTTP